MSAPTRGTIISIRHIPCRQARRFGVFTPSLAAYSKAVAVFNSTHKICTKCGIDKSLSDFVKDRRNKDGRGPSCKQCKNSLNRKEFYAGGKARLEAWKKAHPARMAEMARRKEKRYRAGHPEQVRARWAVQKAVLSGKLPRVSTLKCAYCKNQARNYHHHVGYAVEHRLDVVPVCIPCHKLLHDH